MDILSKLGETLSATGKEVSQKAKDLTGLAKLNMDIRAKEEYVLRHYTEIGRQYYEMHKDDVDPFFEEMKLITDAKREIERLKAQIGELKGQKTCPSCGNVMDIENAFCAKCGEKYDSVVEEDLKEETTDADKETVEEAKAADMPEPEEAAETIEPEDIKEAE